MLCMLYKHAEKLPKGSKGIQTEGYRAMMELYYLQRGFCALKVGVYITRRFYNLSQIEF